MNLVIQNLVYLTVIEIVSGNFYTINVISINSDLTSSRKAVEENKEIDENISLNNIGKGVEETGIIYWFKHVSVM